MNDNVKKVFEMLGVESNEEFKIQDDFNNCDEHKYCFNENFDVWRINDDGTQEYYSELEVLRILKGIHKIIKLPKKKKLRDLTEEDFRKWRNKNCNILKCNECIFEHVHCTKSTNECWANHKDLYSDKFLDQEVEIPQEEENKNK